MVQPTRTRRKTSGGETKERRARERQRGRGKLRSRSWEGEGKARRESSRAKRSFLQCRGRREARKKWQSLTTASGLNVGGEEGGRVWAKVNEG